MACAFDQRVNFAKGKSDAVAKLDGTWVPKHKRKRKLKGPVGPPPKKQARLGCCGPRTPCCLPAVLVGVRVFRFSHGLRFCGARCRPVPRWKVAGWVRGAALQALAIADGDATKGEANASEAASARSLPAPAFSGALLPMVGRVRGRCGADRPRCRWHRRFCPPWNERAIVASVVCMSADAID